MEDWLTLSGVAVTLGLGLYNFYTAQRSAQRTSIVGAVTAQRLKWSTEIQDAVASFCGTAHYLRSSTENGGEEQRKKIEDIDRLRHLIVLKLCERTGIELEIEALVGNIVSMTSGNSPVSPDDFRAELLELIRKTQDLLRNNWNRIAYEATHGVFADTGSGFAAPPTQLKSKIR